MLKIQVEEVKIIVLVQTKFSFSLLQLHNQTDVFFTIIHYAHSIHIYVHIILQFPHFPCIKL